MAPTHDECDRLTDALRLKLKEHGSVGNTGRQAQTFRSWSKPKAWLQHVENYRAGTVISFIRNMKGIARAGETATVELVSNGMLHLDNGKSIYVRKSSDFIEVGELRKIELCKGDLIQFNVNLREQKIYNGGIAQITDVPSKVMMLYPDGKPRQLVDLPDGYQAFKYGWVTTSHKAQGRTAENVIVAAQSMDRKAFYVALSRGRKFLALHCPEKEFLKQQLSFRKGDRVSIHDLIRDREIPAHAILPLSPETRQLKAKNLPDMEFKTVKSRAAKFAEYLKNIAKNIYDRGKQVVARRARFNKYSYGIVTEKTYFEQGMSYAIEKVAELRKREEYRRLSWDEKLELEFAEKMAKFRAKQKDPAPVPPPINDKPVKQTFDKQLEQEFVNARAKSKTISPAKTEVKPEKLSFDEQLDLEFEQARARIAARRQTELPPAPPEVEIPQVSPPKEVPPQPEFEEKAEIPLPIPPPAPEIEKKPAKPKRGMDL